MKKTKSLTVRLDNEDYAELEDEARRLGMPPATLVRVYVRASLHSHAAPAVKVPQEAGMAALRGLQELRERRRRAGYPSFDGVRVARESREELGERPGL